VFLWNILSVFLSNCDHSLFFSVLCMAFLPISYWSLPLRGPDGLTRAYRVPSPQYYPPSGVHMVLSLAPIEVLMPKLSLPALSQTTTPNPLPSLTAANHRMIINGKVMSKVKVHVDNFRIGTAFEPGPVGTAHYS